ncbi:ATP-binding protein [Streptomyces sp. NPDC002577]
MQPARSASHRPTQLAYEYSLFAPGDATAPKLCRDFVRGVLLALGREPLADAATLCTSELVTNVHLHTKGSAMLRVWLTPARLRVSVFDESPDPPVIATPPPEPLPAGVADSRSSPRSRTRGASRRTGRGGTRKECGSS